MKLQNPLPFLMMKLQGIRYGKGCRFRGMPVMICRGGRIEIGDRLSLASGMLTNLVGLWQRSIFMARDGGVIKIGNRVGMSGVTLYAFKRIEIGDHTLIGANTKIFDSDFHPLDAQIRKEHPNSREHMKTAETIIGCNVFIGCNCLILKGVHIGDNAVIGAGSVVTHDIPANTVAAGNPAMVVREGLRSGEGIEGA